MGVKHLWDIISPSCERKPLYELYGKTIAIDLSCWIVDSQTVTDNVAQPKMYLRNLYFRTVYLLMQGVSPVFVLEGKAPTLKYTEIARRNVVRRGDDSDKRAKKGGRTRFHTVLKECETMLQYMGLKCVKGHGEAEAMCAYLNEAGLVDGCISQDSDCFLYGANTVYRNFCTSAQGNRGGTGGSIDIYSMEKIQRLFELGRNKMIALALLCGCDYDKGVHGVGKEAALKLFQIVDDEDILDRMKSWRTDRKFKRMEAQLKDPNICTSCGHTGKVRVHIKSGCGDCGTVSKCDDSYKEKKSRMSHEISLRQKALSSEEFPSQELIDEFLVRKGPMPTSLDLQWRQPKIIEFVNFMVRHVCWEPEYAFAKIFPLTTRWQLRHFAPIPREDRLFMQGVMIPEKIKKIRNVRSVASYEIVWTDNDGILDGLTLGKTSDKENDSDEIEGNNEPDELVSIEPQDAVLRCYPELVEEFEAARQAKKKKPAKPRERKKKVVPAENDKDPSAAANEPKKKTATRRPRKKAAEVNNKMIDEFVEVAPAPSLEDSFEAMTLAPKRRRPTAIAESERPNKSATPKRGPQFDRVLATARITSVLDGTLGRMFDELTPEDFPSEIDDYSIMGDVIEELCSQRTTKQMDIVDLTLDHFDSDRDDEREMEEAIERLCSKSMSKETTQQSYEKNFDNGKDDEHEMEEAIERLCSKSMSNGTTRQSYENNFDNEKDDEREIEEAIERLCSKSTSKNLQLSFEDDFSCDRENKRKIEESTKRSSNGKRRSQSSVDEELVRSFELDMSDEEAAASSIKKKPVVANRRSDKSRVTVHHEISDESDEFDVVYVPLSQRIKSSIPPNSSRNNRNTSKRFSMGVDDLMCDSD